MKIQPDNIFVGANITDKDNNSFLVIKVNAKSFYAAKGITLADYNFQWNARVKGTTFKKFCELRNYQMYKYDDNFEITNEEIAKKEVVSQAAKNVNSDILGKAEKMILSNLVKYNKIKKLVNIQVGNDIMRIIDYKDKDKFLLNTDSCYVLYNSSLDISYKVCGVYEWGDKVTSIPWEKVTPNLKKE